MYLLRKKQKLRFAKQKQLLWSATKSRPPIACCGNQAQQAHQAQQASKQAKEDRLSKTASYSEKQQEEKQRSKEKKASLIRVLKKEFRYYLLLDSN